EVTVGDAHACVFERATKPFLTLPQGCFGLLPLGNVPRQGHREAAATLPERLAPDLYREDRPILAAVSRLERHQLAVVELALELLKAGGSDIGVEVDRSHPMQLVPCVPQAFAGLTIHIEDHVSVVEQEE